MNVTNVTPNVRPVKYSIRKMNYGLWNISARTDLDPTTAKSAFSKNRVEGNFENVTSGSASEKAIPGVLGDFFGYWTLSKKRCCSIQEFICCEIILLPILGCDQQNLEKKSSGFKESGHRSAHVFADGSSTALHNRNMTLLEAPTGTFLFYYKDIQQEIVHTLLLEEYGVSKKWVIIMKRRQESKATSGIKSDSSKKNGPSAQDN